MLLGKLRKPYGGRQGTSPESAASHWKKRTQRADLLPTK